MTTKIEANGIRIEQEELLSKSIDWHKSKGRTILDVGEDYYSDGVFSRTCILFTDDSGHHFEDKTSYSRCGVVINHVTESVPTRDLPANPRVCGVCGMRRFSCRCSWFSGGLR